MTYDRNPFEFEAANNLPDSQILAYYIDDHNYSRFLESGRNVFLVGQRGSGKTMALLYNSWKIQRLRAEQQGAELPLRSIGIYVPCNTPLTHKAEYELLEDRLGSVVSEHFLALSITSAFVDTLGSIQELHQPSDPDYVHEEIGFILGESLPNGTTIFDSLKQFIRRELLRTQRSLNAERPDAFYPNTYTFNSLFVPILYTLSEHIEALQNSHFRLMMDDAHILNKFQIKSLNSWISYRDHSRFSFKVAVAKVGKMTKLTATGGSIFEGHDYITVDLEAPLHNRHTRFYDFAHSLVQRRLKNVSIDVDPEDFFPMSVDMRNDLDEVKSVVRREALAKYGGSDKAKKQVTDHVYKYTRARYFRQRDPKSNLPPYSGFELLVFLSTGVVRNLLEPCFWMFDRVVSQRGTSLQSTHIAEIPSKIQTDVILEISDRQWKRVKDLLAHDIDGCGSEDSLHAYQLLDALAKLFRDRLAKHKSEPCALSFTISAQHSDSMASDRIHHLLEILRTAQLLYVRSGAGKEVGQREDYYVPNRILWPIRGLDPQGQHARVSIPESALWEAAQTGAIPFEKARDERQGDLWS